MIPIGAEEPFIPLVQPVPETSGPQVIELWVPEDEGPNRINAIKAKITEKFVVIQDLGSKLAFRISTFTLFKGKVQTVAENEVRRSDLTSFTCFQFLPVEIRLKIFKLAFEPQLVLWQGAKFLGPPEFQRSFQMKGKPFAPVFSIFISRAHHSHHHRRHTTHSSNPGANDILQILLEHRSSYALSHPLHLCVRRHMVRLDAITLHSLCTAPVVPWTSTHLTSSTW